MVISFNVLKYFSGRKLQNKFFSICQPVVTRSQTGRNDVFSEFLTHITVGLIEKGLLFLGKMLVCGWNLPYLEVNGIYK